MCRLCDNNPMPSSMSDDGQRRPSGTSRYSSTSMTLTSDSRMALSIILVLIMLPCMASASLKYNQRTFLNTKAINFVDPTKHGFRIMLRDEFVSEHLAPILLPTLYVSAIPLRSDEPAVSRTFYPDSIQQDKQVNIADLKEKSWYYLCIEWENFNRHNETTGTDCRIFRTLDRFGKGVDTTVDEIEPTDVSSQMFMFRLHTSVDFPIRITVSLQGGVQVAAPPAQIFHIGENSDLDVIFPFLRQQKDYGRLCILEEPLVNRFSAMGRLVSGLHIYKCYFGNLRTKDYELSILDSEASPYRRSSTISLKRPSATFVAIVATFSLLYGAFMASK